ncbi:MAG: hypothetical protein C0436_05545 [Alphaproteobacteria bacterium]|nr:hypothetical protein [Alphaproteobacteria bacterium]
MVNLYGIPVDKLTDNLWERIEPLLKLSCDGAGTEDPDDVRDWVLDRSVQLWVLADTEIEGVLITEISMYPKISIARVRHYSGPMSQPIYTMISEVVSAWAKAQGCSKLELWGRPGWERLAGQSVSRSFFVIQSEL